MRHFYIDADQLSKAEMQTLIYQYISFTHKENHETAFLHFTFNDHQPQKKQLLQKYQAKGVVGIQVPSKKQAADMMIIAYMQEQLTKHKFLKKDLKIALLTKDKTLFSIAELICQRYLTKLEQYDLAQIASYFDGTESCQPINQG